MLKVHNLNVFYGKLQVLWDVSLHVEEGEIVALIGANGAGKTTLLNTISSFHHPASGTVEFLGKRIDKIAPHSVVALGISHIPEGKKLFPDMTVRENLELGAYASAKGKEVDARLDEVYQIFPALKQKKNELPRRLSGGVQQMLAMGRGLMSRPKLCMFDEPSSGLAPIVIKEVLNVIKALRDQGTTTLLVEQNTQHALGIADRGYVLENGRITLEGTGAELLQNEHVKVAYLGL
ncbi:MAG: amino acid transporter ATPase [Deltaproteobacteria bacterium]|jgi:branched-chain amino acid transport system ATP-binding protein|nr:amino acid transporter ATPase [Deltaproteobacteria bacterium]